MINLLLGSASVWYAKFLCTQCHTGTQPATSPRYDTSRTIIYRIIPLLHLITNSVGTIASEETKLHNIKFIPNSKISQTWCIVGLKNRQYRCIVGYMPFFRSHNVSNLCYFAIWNKCYACKGDTAAVSGSWKLPLPAPATTVVKKESVFNVLFNVLFLVLDFPLGAPNTLLKHVIGRSIWRIVVGEGSWWGWGFSQDWWLGFWSCWSLSLTAVFWIDFSVACFKESIAI